MFDELNPNEQTRSNILYCIILYLLINNYEYYSFLTNFGKYLETMYVNTYIYRSSQKFKASKSSGNTR